MLAGVHPGVASALDRTGIGARLGSDNIVAATPQITRSLDDAYARATSLLREA